MTFGTDVVYLQQLQQENSNGGLLPLTQGCVSMLIEQRASQMAWIFPYSDINIGQNLDSRVQRDCL